MEVKDIEYVKLSEMFNDYAINKLYDILEKYGIHASKETIEDLENKIINNKIIIINHPSIEDNKRFNNDIPIAHGGRVKEDGLIHIYPYVACQNVFNTKELFQHIIDNGIITHEIFHYFIHLDNENIDDQEKESFIHFINEGLVQSYTEEHEKKHFLIMNIEKMLP